MKYGLEDSVILRIQQVFAEFPQIQKAIIYGSRAKDAYRPGSDIDLSLHGENLNLSEMNKIALALDDLLLPYTFDVSVYSHIKNIDLLDHINRVGIEFYSK